MNYKGGLPRGVYHSLAGPDQANAGAFGDGNDFFAREFGRFVLVQQYVGKLAMTAIEYPPMQDPASFNLESVKRQMDESIKNRPGQ